MRWLSSITNAMDMNLSKLREIVEDRGTWHAAVHGVTESRAPLSNGTSTTTPQVVCMLSSHLNNEARETQKN